MRLNCSRQTCNHLLALSYEGLLSHCCVLMNCMLTICVYTGLSFSRTALLSRMVDFSWCFSVAKRDTDRDSALFLIQCNLYPLCAPQLDCTVTPRPAYSDSNILHDARTVDEQQQRARKAWCRPSEPHLCSRTEFGSQLDRHGLHQVRSTTDSQYRLDRMTAGVAFRQLIFVRTLGALYASVTADCDEGTSFLVAAT